MQTIYIIAISILAGLTTGIGGLIAISLKPREKLFCFLMGFSVGIMVVLAFFGLILKSWNLVGGMITIISFGTGAMIMLLFDLALPHIRFSIKEKGLMHHTFFSTGILIAIGIALHNIPEGISIGAGYAGSSSFGLFIAIAIALHNIPEGIAIALPLIAEKKSKWYAFKTSLFSGLAEPCGAIFAIIFLSFFKPIAPLMLAFAGGIMLFITFDELIPYAHKRGHEHYTSFGIIVGTICMMLFFIRQI